jgi:hypothetical protein
MLRKDMEVILILLYVVQLYKFDMKIKELIAELQKLDPEISVVISGSRGGFEELREIKNTNIVLHYHEAQYLGHAEEENWVYKPVLEKAEKEGRPYTITKACILSRNERTL